MALFNLCTIPIHTTGDEAGPVGAYRILQPIKARSVGVDGRGEIVFGPEVPLDVGTFERSIVLGNEEIFRFRMEFKFNTERQPQIYQSKKDGEVYSFEMKPGCSLVMAEWPYSRGRSEKAFFKTANKAEPERKEKDLGKKIVDRPKAKWWSFLEDENRDWWEQDGKYLTAAISSPLSMDVTGTQRDGANAYRICGVCENYDDLFRKIKSDKRMTDLTLQTAVEPQDRSNPSLPQGGVDPIKIGQNSQVRLHETTKAIAVDLLESCICYALAGPREEGEEPVGQPVIEYVEKIYKQQLNRVNKAEAAKRSAERLAVEGKDFGEVLPDPGSLLAFRTSEARHDLERLIDYLKDCDEECYAYLRTMVALCSTSNDPTREEIAAEMKKAMNRNISVDKITKIKKRTIELVKSLDEEFIPSEI